MLKNHGLKTAIKFGEKAINYQEFYNRIAVFSKHFELNAGDHAVIFSENTPAWVTAFYAVWQKKGVAVPIDFMATASEVAYILKDSEPVVIFFAQNWVKKSWMKPFMRLIFRQNSF